jgi:hypothetical protein
MRTSIGSVVILAGAMGFVTGTATAADNSSLAPLTLRQPDYILNDCQETESTGDPSSAMRTVDPAGMLAVYMQNHNNRNVDMAMLAAIKTTLLQDTSHGKITSVIDNTGRPWYAYDPIPDYVGNDRAAFLAEFEGKVYKIVVELHVFRTVNENNPTCPDPQLIKVTKPAKPSSGANGYHLRC